MIHVSLEGIVKTHEDEQALIKQIEAVTKRMDVLFEIEQGIGTITICPCGVIDVQIEHYYAVLKTNTALAGLGYHVFVCELFEQIQKEGPIYMAIDDECDYLSDHDADRLRKTAFYPYMSTLMEGFSKMKEEDEATYAWENKSYLPIAKEKSVITPLGYIYADKCKNISIEEACRVMYIWNNLEKDAYFYRNCALVSLWCDCLFEKSHFDEASLALASSICIALEKAHALDQALPLPVDEYQLLCRELNRPIQIFDVDQYPNENIGYRKQYVFFVYGNWFIYFQGNAIQRFDGHSMILEIKEEDETRLKMEISGYKNDEKMDFAYRYLNTVNALDQLDYEEDGLKIKSVLHELQDEQHTLYLQAQCIKDNELLMINVECADMQAYAQAVHTLENMQMIPQKRGEKDVSI